MLKPSELQQYEFKSAGRNAYKADDVDSFFGEVLVNYEKLYRNYNEYSKRVSLLADQLAKYKADDVDIKQAVLSAQKAADIIKKDAETAATQMKEEAESVLAAAKGEADIIKRDAEKQAIADSDLLLAMARDKAEEIIKKAKEKAHGILIAANNSASDTVGAANRTITSESIHYDMLKKEVSEFRASILAQYKAHIELISKLPELAIEEASKITTDAPEVEVSVDELEDFDAEENAPEADAILDFDEISDDDTVIEDTNDDSTEIENEDVSDEFVSEDSVDVEEENIAEAVLDDSNYADIPISKKFSVSTDDLVFEGFESDDSEVSSENFEEELSDESEEEFIEFDEDTESVDVEKDERPDTDTENADEEPIVFDDVFSNETVSVSISDNDDNTDTEENNVTAESSENRRSRYARMFGDVDADDDSASDEDNNSFYSFFDSIETIDADDVEDSDKNDDQPSKSKFSFFRKKK